MIVTLESWFRTVSAAWESWWTIGLVTHIATIPVQIEFDLFSKLSIPFLWIQNTTHTYRHHNGNERQYSVQMHIGMFHSCIDSFHNSFHRLNHRNLNSFCIRVKKNPFVLKQKNPNFDFIEQKRWYLPSSWSQRHREEMHLPLLQRNSDSEHSRYLPLHWASVSSLPSPQSRCEKKKRQIKPLKKLITGNWWMSSKKDIYRLQNHKSIVCKI